MISSRISVIIPTVGRNIIVERFIASLNTQTLLPAELIIVDGSTETYEVNFRKLLISEIKLIYQQCEPGLAYQRNVGLDLAYGEILFFFDDDIILEPNYLATTLATFDKSNNSVAVVYGRIIDSPLSPNTLFSKIHTSIGNIQNRIFYLARAGNGKFLPSGFPTFIFDRERARETEYMPGGLTAYRSEIIKRFRFDEHLTKYSFMEDDDIGYRLSRQYKILYLPEARCQHLHASMNRLSPFEASKMLLINHHYLFRKNFPHTIRNRYAHILSLIGYPLEQLWNLNLRKFFGSLYGIWSIIFKCDPLSKISQF